MSRDVSSSRLRSSLPQTATNISVLSNSLSHSQGSRQSSAKRISFSSLYTPKENADTYLASRFFQLNRPGLKENSRFNKRKLKSARSELGPGFFHESECAASEIGKEEIHQKIIGKPFNSIKTCISI
jgi:hypothetical protein